jgi:hypothetical protein
MIPPADLCFVSKEQEFESEQHLELQSELQSELLQLLPVLVSVDSDSDLKNLLPKGEVGYSLAALREHPRDSMWGLAE